MSAPSGGTARPRAAATLAAVGELRLRLFWHRLRGRGGLAEALAHGLGFVLAAMAGAGVAAMVGLASWRAARAGHGLDVVATASALFFGLGMAWTALALTVNEREILDLRRLLVYPIPAGRLYAAAVASAMLADPLAAFMGLALLGSLAGAAVARPGAWLLLLALALLLFAAATASLIALFQEILARLSRSRFFREIAIGAALLGWMALATVASTAKQMPAGAWRAAAQLRWVFFPPALATEAVVRLYGGALLSALPFLAALALAAILTGVAAYRMALGTALAGGDGAVRVAQARRGGSLWPEKMGPLLEKEILYLLRHPVARISAVIVPVLAAFFAWRGGVRLAAHPSPIWRAMPLFAIAVYVHLALQVFWLNAFGWDRGGARTFFLAPVSPLRVLAAKNVALSAMALALFLAGAAAWIAVAGSPGGRSLAAALLLNLGAGPVLYGAGNAVSIVNPRAAAFGLQRGSSVPQLSAVVGMALFTGAAAALSPPILLALWLDAPRIVAAGWALLGAGAWIVWWLTLPAAAALLERRRDELLDAVCSDDAFR